MNNYTTDKEDAKSFILTYKVAYTLSTTGDYQKIIFVFFADGNYTYLVYSPNAEKVIQELMTEQIEKAETVDTKLMKLSTVGSLATATAATIVGIPHFDALDCLVYGFGISKLVCYSLTNIKYIKHYSSYSKDVEKQKLLVENMGQFKHYKLVRNNVNISKRLKNKISNRLFNTIDLASVDLLSLKELKKLKNELDRLNVPNEIEPNILPDQMNRDFQRNILLESSEPAKDAFIIKKMPR